METDRFDRIVWGIIAALMLFIGGLIWGSSLIGIRIEDTLPKDGGEVGMLGPISISFAQAMDQKSVESNFSLSSNEPGAIIWNDNTMMFYPSQPLDVGESYTATLLPGSQGESNGVVKDEISWSFSIREPWIAFLSYDNPGRDIYRLLLSGGEPEQLTFSNGKVFDFSPSHDGQSIAYSHVNEENGIDIWTMANDGSDPQKLIDCRNHRCSTPAWSPDGTQIAYTRSEAGLGPDEPYSAPRVWLFDLSSGVSARLFANTQKIGFGPTWSPDGTKLTYVEGISNLLVVVDVASGDEFQIPNQLGSKGTWSPDSEKLLFGDSLADSNVYHEMIYQADLKTEDVIVLYGDLPNDNQYFNPQWSPDGKWIAVGTRPPGSYTNRSLMILSAGDTFGLTIADDPDFAYSNYRFDPSGRYLLYQRIELGKAYAQPEVFFYEISTGTNQYITGNASFPAWLP